MINRIRSLPRFVTSPCHIIPLQQPIGATADAPRDNDSALAPVEHNTPKLPLGTSYDTH